MEDDRISVPVWAKVAKGYVRRGALEPSHPLSTFSYVKGLGLDPAQFGIPSAVPYDAAEHAQTGEPT